MIRVLLIEPHTLWRSALLRVISKEQDIEAAGLTRVTEAISNTAVLKKTTVCIVSIDQKSHHNNLSAVHKLSTIAKCPLLVIADTNLASSIYNAMGNYVQGFVSRNIEPELMAGYIRKIANGEQVIESTLAVAAICAEVNPLTETECKVLQAIRSGKRNKEIAADLHLTEGTIRNKLTRILRKTNTRSRIEALQKAQDAGWL